MANNEIPQIPVVVEVLLISAASNGLRYRVRRQALTAADHPDRIAAELSAGPEAGVKPGRRAGDHLGDGAHELPQVLHSTSWRHIDGTVVLTYAAVPDPDPDALTAHAIGGVIAQSGYAARPSPDHIPLGAVAAHAIRHLAWLRRTDQAVAAALASNSALSRALDRVVPALGGAVAHAVHEPAGPLPT